MKITHLEVAGLCEDVLQRGADLRIRVTGKSMAPFLKGGEYLTIRQVPPPSLKTGDLILFNSQGSLVLHRIVGKSRSDSGGTFFQTQGDASTRSDAPVHQDDVLGRVLRIEKPLPEGHRQINLESVPWRVLNSFLARTSPARTMVRRMLLRLAFHWRHLRREEARVHE